MVEGKKCWYHLLYVVFICICNLSLAYLQKENVKKSKKIMKIVNIDEETSSELPFLENTGGNWPHP